ncbi:hypothetical protein B296_00040166 [Ensete ventricosum]|uniref:Uncharacterized protein n=1 Tax=Ensete ventricosum TaxID=4639 RepID=A0A426XXQ4_ENSVE|nr:hypothetical protein B296_00040166 [Ensete ventricosum]
MRLGSPAGLLSRSPPKLKNLRYRHRTRGLPFSHAEFIAFNSPFTLDDLVSQLRFTPAAVAADVKVAFRRFLTYRPINEFEFFFESIGLPPSSSPAAASYRDIFPSDEARLLASVSALVHFGFPWTKLGLLYREEPSVFSSEPRLPRNWGIFVIVDEAVIAENLKYLTKLGMEEQKVGPFILGCPDLLGFDLENPSVAMPEYLNRGGLDKNEVTSLSQRYPYVMGKNKLGNLPGMMRAMDLHSWFISRIWDGNYHYLSSSFVSAAPHDTAIESGFLQGLDRVKRLKEQFVDNKLEFLLGIGFGENKITVRTFSLINSTKDQLQEHFDHLLEMGIE